MPLKIGGFYTWNGGEPDPHIYMKPAVSSTEEERYCLASYDLDNGGLIGNMEAFEKDGVRILTESNGDELIIMDELGFLEAKAPAFRQTVLDILAGDVPVLGVLRLGDVPWHQDIKRNPEVAIYDISEKNRDTLPRELATRLRPKIRDFHPKYSQYNTNN